MVESPRQKADVVVRSLRDHVRVGVDAAMVLEGLSSGLRSDPKDDGEWNRQARTVRISLKQSERLPAECVDDMLAKAELLAWVIYREGEHDQRYRLAQSLLDDIEAMNEKKAQTGKARSHSGR